MFPCVEVESIIKYEFKDKEILKRAFTHSSLGSENNERLEFLGDSVLGYIVTCIIFDKYKLREGDLTKLRSNIVCEKNLSKTIYALNLDKYILLGNSYKGKPSRAMCCDLCEAIIGAIYLDSNHSVELAKKFIENFVSFDVEREIDYKTTFQEKVQITMGNEIVYQTVQIGGTDNNPIFESKLILNGKIVATATGKNKREAEQNSAKIALENK